MFKVKIPGHLNHMSKGLYDLQTRREMCDLRLISETKTIDLHKVVLASMDDLALAKIRTNTSPDGVASIHIPECPLNIVESVIRCIYLGELQFNTEDAQTILLLCSHLGLSKITSYFKDHPILKNTKSTRGQKRKAKSDEDTLDKIKRTVTSTVVDSQNESVATEDNEFEVISGSQSLQKKGRGRPRKITKKKAGKTVVEADEKEPADSTLNLEPPDHIDATEHILEKDNAEENPIEDKAELIREQEEELLKLLADQTHETSKQIEEASLEEDEPETLKVIENNRPNVKTLAEAITLKSRQSKTCYKCHELFQTAEECASHRSTCIVQIKKTDPKTIKALPFVCRKCLNRFPIKPELDTHKESCQVKRQRIERKCRKCLTVFDDLAALKEHRKIHTAEWNKAYVRVKPVFTCEVCQYKCNNEKALLTHSNKAHKVPLVGNDKHPVLQCKACSYKTLFQFQLKNHEFTHASERSFVCDMCGSAFKQRAVLDAHIHTVHAQPQVECMLCFKVLKTKAALTAHIKRVHNQEKNISCPECSFKCFDASTMESHRHSKHNVPFPDERKTYLCEHCSYSTRWKCQYDAHMRRHTGICPYTCRICRKRFPAKSDLTSHEKWHFDKKFKCEKCKFSTCVPGKLKTHIRNVHTHRDVKPFVCHVCDYRTNLKSNLVLHLRKVHKIKVDTKKIKVETISNAVEQQTDVGGESTKMPTANNTGISDSLLQSTIQQNSTESYNQTESNIPARPHSGTVLDNANMGTYMANLRQFSNVQVLQTVSMGIQSSGSQLSQAVTVQQAPLGVDTGPKQEDLLAAATKASLGKLQKPVIIQLKSAPGQIFTLQQLQEQLQQQALQHQQIQQQQQMQIAVTPNQPNQVLQTLEDYTLPTPQQVAPVQTASATGTQLQRDPVAAIDKTVQPVIFDYNQKYHTLTAPTATMVATPSESVVYPEPVGSQNNETQSAAELMAPYASLIQVHIDSLGQSTDPNVK